ncbi:hypothetical protein SDC9_111089 [bioreactor metagenome]|uniref:Uncharacterized protein n=1 Tax=bioreactor metagenome TaxID=1076179 RepID=A0A645BLR2_9ZZZZ
MDLDELFGYLISVSDHARAQGYDHVVVIDRVAQIINTGNAADNNNVPAFKKGCGSRMAELVYFIVDRGIFFYIGISMRNVGLGLIIIIVGNEILHRVFGKKLLEFAAKLRRQCFVVCQNKGWLLHI